MTFRHEVQANVSARAAQPKRPKPAATVVDWDASGKRVKAMLAELYGDSENDGEGDAVLD